MRSSCSAATTSPVGRPLSPRGPEEYGRRAVLPHHPQGVADPPLRPGDEIDRARALRQVQRQDVRGHRRHHGVPQDELLLQRGDAARRLLQRGALRLCLRAPGRGGRAVPRLPQDLARQGEAPRAIRAWKRAPQRPERRLDLVLHLRQAADAVERLRVEAVERGALHPGQGRDLAARRVREGERDAEVLDGLPVGPCLERGPAREPRVMEGLAGRAAEPVMVGEDARRQRATLLDRPRRREVQPRPRLLWRPGVGRLAQLVVREPQPIAPRCLQDLTGHERLDRIHPGRLVHPGRREQEGRVHLAPEDGRERDERAARRVEGRQAPLEQLGDGGRHVDPRRERPRVPEGAEPEAPVLADDGAFGDGGAQVLGDEEGVALAALVHERDERRRHLAQREHARDHPRHPLGVEAAQPDRLRARRADEIGELAARLLRPIEAEHDHAAPGEVVAVQLAQEREGELVGPLHVVEHQEERRLGREREDPRAERAEQPPAGRVRREQRRIGRLALPGQIQQRGRVGREDLAVRAEQRRRALRPLAAPVRDREEQRPERVERRRHAPGGSVDAERLALAHDHRDPAPRRAAPISSASRVFPMPLSPPMKIRCPRRSPLARSSASSSAPSAS